MNGILPVIIGGGKGTRLWPQSRAESPKQFHKVALDDRWTLFQETIRRHSSEGLFRDPLCVIGKDHLPIVRAQIADLGMKARYLLEPEGRNTGPALAAAALLICETDPDTVMLTLPSDHVVGEEFIESVKLGMAAVAEGRLVTFGIKPTGPESGFGYIVSGDRFGSIEGLRHVVEFVEKPDSLEAEGLIENGARWASGIGMYRAGDFIELFEKHAPDIVEHARRAVMNSRRTAENEEFVLDRDSYVRCRPVSTEESVLQKCAKDLVMVEVSADWDDVGAWNAYHRIGEKDESRNVTSGDAHLHEAENCYVRADGRLVALVGVKDLVVVDTPDAVLVVHMDKTQGVKAMVDRLSKMNRPEILRHLKLSDEWGHRRTLCRSGDLPVEEISVSAGTTATIGPESFARSLVVTDGHLDVTVGTRREQLSPGGTCVVAIGQTLVMTTESVHALAILAGTRSGPSLVVVEGKEKSVNAA